MKTLFVTLWRDPKAARKFIAALLGAVIVAASHGLLPAAIAGWVVVVTPFITALGVYSVRNRPVAQLNNSSENI